MLCFRIFVPPPNSVELRDVLNGDVQSSIALDNSHCFSERDSVSNKCAKIELGFVLMIPRYQIFLFPVRSLY